MSVIKENERKVSRITREYLKAARVLHLQEEGYRYMLEKIDDETLGNLYMIVQRVETALAITAEETTFFIYNEFLCSNRSSWWQEFYSRSTYFRHKAKAMSDFLDCYEERSYERN